MGFSRYPLGLALRVGGVAGAAALLGLLLVTTEFYATAFIVAVLLAAALAELTRHANAIGRDLTQVTEAIAAGELMPVLPRRLGPLGARLGRAIDKLGERNAARETAIARLNAEVEHAPVPLLSLAEDGRITLLNRAARRFFDGVDLARLDQAEALSHDFAAALAAPPGRRMVQVPLPGGVARVLVATSQTIAGGRAQAIASLLSIEGELAQSELRAWSDLVRVLAHEMMNSLTPVASLAGTAEALVAELRETLPDAEPPALDELAEAMAAIARRSAGLMRFVDGYRRFAEPPEPVRRTVPLTEAFGRVRALMQASPAGAGVAFEVAVEPPGLSVEADPDLIDQALINLVKNAFEAVAGCPAPRVTLAAALDGRGRVAVTVEDNGPGLPPGAAEQIFVPFFTTKPAGSGIGLSLVRQIMVAHGGSVEPVPRGPSTTCGTSTTCGMGATFRLTF
ncbi:histidine kinase [Aliidongia dinghuensis]|uniref:histidine kinase n=1 Tax=Aliidongia dinghuensis TaxID=1867774 RepID=A0A8J3E6V1_9PROT|nr:ATP-binding protein [Aliidongia dinghuensis]GGF32879.1 histidine kinase [Aliidongia dinghuensis]